MNRITFLKIQPVPAHSAYPCKRIPGCGGWHTHEVITGGTETDGFGDKTGTSTTRKGCLDHCRELAPREMGRLEP